jgi:hypothetical protein
VLRLLREYELERAVQAREILTWAAETLMRTDSEPTPPDANFEYSYQSYRELRSAEQRTSIGFVLAEIGLRVTPELTNPGKRPEEVMIGLRAKLGEMPDAVCRGVCARDTARIERSIAFLEQFWQSLQTPPAAPEVVLRRFAKSGFFVITTEEAALSRFALEAKLVGSLIPGANVDGLLRRISELNETSNKTVRNLVEQRSKRQWDAVFRAPGRA